MAPARAGLPDPAAPLATPARCADRQRQPIGAGSPLRHETHARAVDVGAVNWVKEFTECNSLVPPGASSSEPRTSATPEACVSTVASRAKFAVPAGAALIATVLTLTLALAAPGAGAQPVAPAHGGKAP